MSHILKVINYIKYNVLVRKNKLKTQIPRQYFFIEKVMMHQLLFHIKDYFSKDKTKTVVQIQTKYGIHEKN